MVGDAVEVGDDLVYCCWGCSGDVVRLNAMQADEVGDVNTQGRNVL